jgi:hypothetical protein
MAQTFSRFALETLGNGGRGSQAAQRLEAPEPAAPNSGAALSSVTDPDGSLNESASEGGGIWSERDRQGRRRSWQAGAESSPGQPKCLGIPASPTDFRWHAEWWGWSRGKERDFPSTRLPSRVSAGRRANHRRLLEWHPSGSVIPGERVQHSSATERRRNDPYSPQGRARAKRRQTTGAPPLRPRNIPVLPEQ